MQESARNGVAPTELIVDSLEVITTTPLNRLEANLPMRDLRGCWWVKGLNSIPEAVALARSVARQLPLDELNYSSWTEIEIGSPGEPKTPSGVALRSTFPGVVIDRDPEHDFRKVWLQDSAPIEGAGAWKAPAAHEVPAKTRQEVRLGPQLPERPDTFVGGLISLSAEPPEGFFAASTSAELAKLGYPIVTAEEARVWLYRVPDSRPDSYFRFHYPNPDRPRDGDRGGKFLIASGVGPANDPASSGGAEADLLWMGDEQHGPLHQYLRTLARHDLRLSDLAKHRGLAQRLPGGVLLSGLDQTHALTRQGFNSLATEPALYRRIYSQEYDEYLRTLFHTADLEPAGASYLLATSRGCTQGCALRCSGGLKAFQSFSAQRMMAELRKLARPQELVEIFFLDSNFNNHPGRLIEFAQRYQTSELFGRFRFFVRHNTVNGFLKRQGDDKVPNLELIEAFKILGIREVFMGVDTFDEAATLTLKSNRVHLARKGTATRATYTPAELYQLVAALQQSGALIRTFYLQNNPWVSDFDRLDSYFNIARLWLDFPNFSIDTRERQVNRLKPFAGSPIAQVSRGRFEREGRYVAEGAVGEMDERMTLSYFGVPQCQSDRQSVMKAFKAELEALRAALEEAGATDLIAKLLSREFPEVACSDFQQRWSHLSKFDPRIQKQAFEEKSRTLMEGLAETLPPRADRANNGAAPINFVAEPAAPSESRERPSGCRPELPR